MYLPMDPTECSWTPEGEELQSDIQAWREAMLDLMAEEEEYELVQYPQRFSH